MAAPSLELERRLLTAGRIDALIAVDEVGRGALAGPVSLGAVLIDSAVLDAPQGLRDSKALSASARQRLVPSIRAWARAWTVVDVPAQRIDEVGIVRALGEGAVAAVVQVVSVSSPGPTVVLLDGPHDFVSPVDASWPVHTVVKGDASCASIAAASILAKVHRDAAMRELHEQFPHYAWNRNVGYGTAEHRRGLQAFGPAPAHRRTWRLLDE